MPEYLAPGVFVEETSFRQKTIEGVSTSTSGFIGPTRFGPVNGEPELLTSYSEFERIYGGIDQLDLEDVSESTHNYLAHAVRAYFEEGGRRLYVARVFDANSANFNPNTGNSSYAQWPANNAHDGINLRARHPGKAGDFNVTFIFKLGDNALTTAPIDPADPDGESYPILRGVGQNDVVYASTTNTSPPGADPDWYWVERFFDDDIKRDSHRLHGKTSSPPTGVLELKNLHNVRKLTVSVLVGRMGAFSDGLSWEDLSLHLQHPNSLSNVFTANPADRSTELYVPLIFSTSLANGADIADALMSNNSLVSTGSPVTSVNNAWAKDSPSEAERSFTVTLQNGNDGNLPTPSDYQGRESTTTGIKSALRSFEDLDNISILAAPGSSFNYEDLHNGSGSASVDEYPQAIARRLITHCERMRYRVAVLDSVNKHILSDVRSYRSGFDSSRAAFYYPWIRTFDPLTEQFIDVPPSGSMCGIYARNDIDRGVHKAPANEVIRMASGLENVLNKSQQEVLNPLGINCLRFFEGRGYRVWGARTASSDPEWKYLNVRRYFAFLERSIERGTQWAVFENNGVALWDNVRRTIDDFLFNEWQQNHLAGSKPDQAYFIRCDRTTMTQNDLDNGRMICLIGVAPLRPAEFVIFRIGQKTVESR